MGYPQGDFQYVELTSKHIRSLLAAGVERSRIETKRDGWKRYGTQCYPQKIHQATVAYVEPPNPEQLTALIATWQKRVSSDVIVCGHYHCAD